MSYQRATTKYIPDSAPRESFASEFSIDSMQSAISYALGLPGPVDNYYWWRSVVYAASQGRAKLSIDQLSHLQQWVNDNWFILTEHFSDRYKEKLKLKLK